MMNTYIGEAIGGPYDGKEICVDRPSCYVATSFFDAEEDRWKYLKHVYVYQEDRTWKHHYVVELP